MTWRRGDVIFCWLTDAAGRRDREVYYPAVATKTAAGRIIEAVRANGEIISEGGRPLYAMVCAKGRRCDLSERR